MSEGGTTLERLTRIETLLEAHVKASERDRKEFFAKFEEHSREIEALDTRLRSIEGTKDKAAGLLIMLGTATAGAGAGIAKAIEGIFR
ncbi:hypothetical protein UFOVP407_8 [uncultured Caudovirales phage]|uniref:Uncharacterized protein n=1 Tax=uncultured Caudovirales phage TaxID=2100421 RepID=A0A6J5M3T4_9CAUD|nr:hypothetical protein UFOVP407_8 [uncultured Caudovirales phage]